MPLRRVYLSVTADQLTRLAGGGELGPAPLRGHAVTARLGRPRTAADSEELEHEAWLAAAEGAASAAASGSGQPARRVIAAADIDGALVTESVAGDVSAVEVLAPIPLRRVVSFHIDEEPGGDEADLLWFDVTELSDVLALLGR